MSVVKNVSNIESIGDVKENEMPKKKKKENDLVPIQEIPALQQAYTNELEVNPEYSVEPDPTGSMKLSQIHKDFIRHYVQFKNVATAAELSGIDMDTARSLFVSYDTQSEIRRINKALYHRQFAAKMLTIDQIGGYLTSLLTDENVPLADQLRTSDKLRVVDLIIKLNELKQQSLDDPAELAMKDIEVEIKTLSVQTIQQMLLTSATVKDKNKAIAQLDPKGALTIEEKAYLSTLPLKDLLSMIETNKKGGADK